MREKMLLLIWQMPDDPPLKKDPLPTDRGNPPSGG